MKYIIEYTDESKNDLVELDGSQRKIVRKAIEKVSLNPLPKNEGGYGKPLGNKDNMNLTGLCKIKLLKAGIRIIYKLVREGAIMKIIVIAARADEEAYKIAEKRYQ